MEMKKVRNTLRWSDNGETLCIEAWGRDSLRVRATMNRGFNDNHISALVPPAKGKAPTIEIGSFGGRITNGALRAEVSWYLGKVRFVNTVTGKEILAEYKDHIWWGFTPRRYKGLNGNVFKIGVDFTAAADEKFYGLGQHQHGLLNQKGATVDLIQRNMETSIPFLLSSRNYGFLWNNPSVGRVELGTNRTRWVSEGSQQIDYWVTTGTSPADIMANYADATGHAPMLPSWASGFWQCKLRYENQEEVLAVAREYKRRRLPLSMMVIDWFHWTLMGDWKFNPPEWPNPSAMVRELQSVGVKLMVSVWPTVNHASPNYPIMKSRDLLVRNDTGSPVHMLFCDRDKPEGGAPLSYYDATNPRARKYLWDTVRKNYTRHGIEAFWLDACEPEVVPMDEANLRFHAGTGAEVATAYPFLHQAGFYEGMRAQGQKEVLNLCRSAWAGSQRVGAAVWTGDINSTFEALQLQVRAGLNIGLSGIPWWTTDIGGFHSGDPQSPYFRELIVRWFQFGAFCPLFRLHGNRIPSGAVKSGGPNEIWSFGEEAYAIISRILHMRERLRPYVMKQMKAASTHGTPVMRPLFFDFPEDQECWSIDDQYMFGPDILVAPVLHEKARKRVVYLPEGTSWRDAWTGAVCKGGQERAVDAPLDTIPVFIRGNARVALGKHG